MEIEIETNQKPIRKYSVPIFNKRPKTTTTESAINNQSIATESKNFETIES